MAHEYTPVVGIEIHVELKTNSKMFCGCKNDPFHAPQPNIYTCPVCLGMPGALPVANKKAVEWTIKIGLALGCKIALFSKFDRKHYFYPDLPKGYQISQYDQPLCYEGLVTTELGDVRITRVHLEEDTGKLLHQEVDGKKVSLIDFNRSSVPLVEIVTEPDIHSPEHAKAYAKKIAQIIKYLEVSDADMEKGSMRLEANISVQTKEENDAGKLPDYKVEVKNLNSFRFIEKAIAYEAKRQADIRDDGALPTQETRGWNESKNQSFPQRSKESAEDYRYFPDPDLPPMRFSQGYIDDIKASLPKLPDQLVSEWIHMGLKKNDAEILVSDKQTMELFSMVMHIAGASDLPKLASQLVNKKIIVDQELLDQSIDNKSILSDTAKDVLKQSAELGATSTIDTAALDAAIQAVIAEQPKAVADYQSGKTQVIGFLMGMVMRKVGKVDSAQLSAALTKHLST